MAIVTGPLLSVSAYGSIGGAMTFRRVGGRQFVGRNVGRPGVFRNSTAVTWRWAYKGMRAVWRMLRDNQLGVWHSSPTYGGDGKYYTTAELIELAKVHDGWVDKNAIVRVQRAVFPAGTAPFSGYSELLQVIRNNPSALAAFRRMTVEPAFPLAPERGIFDTEYRIPFVSAQGVPGFHVWRDHQFAVAWMTIGWKLWRNSLLTLVPTYPVDLPDGQIWWELVRGPGFTPPAA